jgi:hypothetical protein
VPVGASNRHARPLAVVMLGRRDDAPLENPLHVRQRLPALQPARLARVVRVVEALPPPHELPLETSLREAVAGGHGAGLNVHKPMIANPRRSSLD